MQGKCIGPRDGFTAYKLEKSYEMDLFKYIQNFTENPIRYEDTSTNIKNSLKKLLLDIARNIHSKNFAHYDIKLKNVIINTIKPFYISDIKIIDFGLTDNAIKGGEWKGTEGYIDPVAYHPIIVSPSDTQELLDCRLIHQQDRRYGLNHKSDIWSLGQLILKLLFRDDVLLDPFKVEIRSRIADLQRLFHFCSNESK